jgi:ribosomal protein L30/L7E
MVSLFDYDILHGLRLVSLFHYDILHGLRLVSLIDYDILHGLRLRETNLKPCSIIIIVKERKQS